MDEVLDYAATALDWAAENPLMALGGLVLAFGLRWWLNRRSAAERDGIEHLERLQKANRGRYDEFRGP